MQLLRGVLVAAASRTALSAVGESPIQKVLGILADCETKITNDGKAEEKAFNEYVDWCKTGAVEKGFEIKTATADIGDLQATIEKSDSDVSAASKEIESLAQEVTASSADLKAQTGMRKKQSDEFLATEKELVETIDTLERATNILQRKMRAGASMLESKVRTGSLNDLIRVLGDVVDAAGLELHDKKMLVAFAQSEDQDDDDMDDDALGAPNPAAYESKSNSIVDVLEDLKQKAENQLTELRKVEANAQHNFDMMKQSLEDEIEVNNKELDVEKTLKANAQETNAQARGELGVTTKDLETAKETLKNLDQDCMDMAKDHEASTNSRKEELKAIAAAKQAIKDISGGGAEASTYGFLQVSSRGAHFEIVAFVRKLAHDSHSPALAQMAGRISSTITEASVSGADPFVKIKGMLSDMVARLEKEHAEESSHKAYCDKEFKETKTKIAELKYDIEKHSGKLDKSRTDTGRLKDEVVELQRELADMARSQAEAVANRQEENKAFVAFKADLQAGLEGVRLALKALRDYYANEDSSALIQEPGADAALAQQPEKPSGHSAKSGAGGGVINMLEVIESDFGRNLADMEMEEDKLASEYEKYTQENKMGKMLKEKDVKFKSKEAANLDKAITELVTDLTSTQTELDAVLEYSSKIRGMCELKPDTYESRAARRQAEIDGLKGAIQALNGDAAGALLQRQPQHALRGVFAHSKA